MYERMLLPVDERTVESDVLYQVGELAHWADARVTVLNVADTARDSVTMTGTGVVDTLIETGDAVADEVSDVLDSLHVDRETRVLQGAPAPTIVDYADENAFDLIVMPTHGRAGLSRYLLGSVTEKVVQLASTPVMTVRMQADEEMSVPFDRVLVATDGSEAAAGAVAHGIDLAVAADATLHVLTVVTGDSAFAALTEDGSAEERERERKRAARGVVDDVAADAEARGLTDVRIHVVDGDPHEEILAAVDRGEADVVVMGTTGRRGVDRILLGSVAGKTVRSAPVPVVTVASGTE